MSFVQAKCPECGGMLAVDDSKKAAVCQFCSEAFIVQEAVNNYITNNIINNTTNHTYGEGAVIHIESEKERLNTSAETYIKLGDIGKALTVYRELVEKFPDDWHGWWGVIFYDYGSLHDLYSLEGRAKLERKMSCFQKIAPTEEYEKLDKVIKTRMDEVNAKIEQKKAETIDSLKMSVDNAIISDTQHIEYMTKQLFDVRQSYDKAQNELELAVKKREAIEKENKSYKNKQEALESLPYIGVIGAVIFGILGLIAGSDFFMVLVVCVVVGAVAYGVLLVVAMIISALLPGKSLDCELQNAKSKENENQCTVNELKKTISMLESKLNIYQKKCDYEEKNKDFIVKSLFVRDGNDVDSFVYAQLSLEKN